MPVIKLQLRYHQPARFEDQLIIQTRLVALRWVAVTFENRIFRESTSTEQRTLIAEGQVELACIGRDGKIRRFSEDLWTRFDQCLNQQASDQAQPQ